MVPKLKALLLCAGLGTRLRPLTLSNPKCLMPIAGKALLGIWIDKLEKSGFEEVLINTHYFSEKIDEYIEREYKNKKNKIKIQTVFEKKLLGTGATLMENKSFFKDSIGFLIHGDNLTNFDLAQLIKAHHERQKGCLLTMLTFNSENPEQCGIVETDDDGVLIEFHEKIKNPPSNVANAAIYAFDFSLIKYLTNIETKKIDFSNDIIPKLKSRIQTFHTNDLLIDIGTKASFQKANELWEKNNE